MKVRGVGVLAAVLSVSAFAAEPPAPGTAPAEQPSAARLLFTDFLKDQRTIWTRPLHLRRRQAAPLALFAIATAALIATDKKTSNALPNTPDQIRISGAVSHIGAPYATAGLAGSFFVIGRITGDERAQETGFLGAEALADTLAVAGVVKMITRRERPNVDHGRGRFWAGGMSFPSGHSMMSWGLAEVIASEYHEKPLVRVAAYSLATVVALSRFPARQHFLSDVVASSTAGFLIGRYVYRAHHDPERKWELVPLAYANPSSHAYAAGLRLELR